jgi:N6-L-threonylcarbamoyladenine synthase
MKNQKITILAIETSCDETAAAVIVGPKNDKDLKFATPKIKSNIVYSQLRLHQKTKGIVPEVASRAHTEKIISVIKKANEKAKIKLKNIDIIAATSGPGLIGSLLVGIDTAKTISYILDKPIIPINHIEAHIYANFIKKSSKFPAIALIVSGGHTSIVLMRNYDDYKLLGSTIDDAAGEAFDKVANLLNLTYPGGPAIAAAAAKSRTSDHQSPITLPRPMLDNDNFDFSFSGLKTSVLYLIKKLPPRKLKELYPQIAFEFQQAIIDVLVSKTVKAGRIYCAKSILLGGGVASNKILRKKMQIMIKKNLPNSGLFLPDPRFCTDNAAIVGICAYYKYLTDKKSLMNYREIEVNLNPGL